MKTSATKAASKRRTPAPAANDTDNISSERSIWRGSISFGLVQIPVSIVGAERSHELSFHQLDKHDNSPIGYERVNKRTGKKVEWNDIVKGYEISKGNFVIVEDSDFKKANVTATQTIDIQDFVEASDIPLGYFERPYHLRPDGKTSKAYAVLRDAMKKKGLIAIALVVLRTRQHLCAIVPTETSLELELLRFDHELRPTNVRAVGNATPKEVQLAEQLIESMVSPWDPKKYKDTFRDDLLAAIEEKAKTGTIEAHHSPAAHAPPVRDLLAVLRESVHGGAKKAHPKRKSRKHEAA